MWLNGGRQGKVDSWWERNERISDGSLLVGLLWRLDL